MQSNARAVGNVSVPLDGALCDDAMGNVRQPAFTVYICHLVKSLLPKFVFKTHLQISFTDSQVTQ